MRGLLTRCIQGNPSTLDTATALGVANLFSGHCPEAQRKHTKQHLAVFFSTLPYQLSLSQRSRSGLYPVPPPNQAYWALERSAELVERGRMYGLISKRLGFLSPHELVSGKNFSFLSLSRGSCERLLHCSTKEDELQMPDSSPSTALQ